MGIAAYQLFALGAVLSAITVAALWVLKPFERNPDEADRVDRDDSS